MSENAKEGRARPSFCILDLYPIGVYIEGMRFWIVIPFLVLSLTAEARPVSYPGGWTLIAQNDRYENSALLHYTVTPRWSVGYRAAYDRDTRAMFNGIQVNNLLRRWNNPDSQANIYLKSAAGLTEGDVEGFTGLQADWENRRVMVSYENRISFSPNEMRRDYQQEAGFGIAPYVAEFGAFHTWAMLHLVHMPEANDPVQVQPMLRFFKGTVLVEAGYNVTIDKPVLNAMIRF